MCSVAMIGCSVAMIGSIKFMSVHGRAYVEEANKEDHKKIGCYRAQITMCKIVQVKKININFVWKIHTSVSKE